MTDGSEDVVNVLVPCGSLGAGVRAAEIEYGLGRGAHVIATDAGSIVAAMGVEPFIAALEGGADIVIGGRATDTAVLACYPIWKGAPWGSAWHAGKVGECGVQCTANPMTGSGMLLGVGSSGFSVEPLGPDNVCTPQSVSAHMLYENGDPFRLVEPGGILDVTGARYVQRDERTVHVTGSVWEPQPYTLKLEGAGGGPYQTLMLIGIQDPDVLKDIDAFHDRLLHALNRRVRRSIPADVLGEFHVSLRLYGWNAVSGDKVPDGTPAPREIGVLFVATAESQELSDTIARACNPYFFHFSNVAGKELPSYGFPFSPAQVPRGRVYEFKLNHVAEMEDPLELVRTVWIDTAEDGVRLYGADPAQVKRFAVEDLRVVKFSYPRPVPQGGIVERDLHSGQQYVRLLDVELD